MPFPLAPILASLSVGGALAGGIQGNQQKQKAKGVIGQNYRLGRERLGVRQADQRQSQSESLVARGLTGGGVRVGRAVAPSGEGASPTIRSAIGPARGVIGAIQPTAGVPRVSVSGARTLGQQQSADLGSEQQLEQNALLEQRNAALAGVQAEATQNLVGTIGSGIAGAVQGYQTGLAAKAYGGIDPVDPLKSVGNLNVFSDPAWR